MKLFFQILLASALFSILPLSASATATFQKLEDDLATSLTMEDPISCLPRPTPEEGIESEWFMKRTTERVRFKLSYSLLVLNLEIVPEVELVWDRALPDGWTAYKPE